LANCVPGAEVD